MHIQGGGAWSLCTDRMTSRRMGAAMTMVMMGESSLCIHMHMDNDLQVDLGDRCYGYCYCHCHPLCCS